MVHELVRVVDVVVEAKKDGVTDVFMEPVEVCDGDGPLGVTLVLVDEVNVCVLDRDNDVETENVMLLVFDGGRVLVTVVEVDGGLLMEFVALFVDEVL